MPLEKAGIEYTSRGFTKFISDMGKAGDMVTQFGEACAAATKAATESVEASANQVSKSVDQEVASLNKLGSAFSGIFGNMRSGNFGAGIGGMIGSVIPGIGTAIGATLGSIEGQLFRFKMNLIKSLATLPVKIVKGVLDFGIQVGNAFITAGKRIIAAIRDIIKTVGNILAKLFSIFSLGGGGGYRGLGDSLFAAMFKFEILKQVIRKVINEFKEFMNIAAQAAITLQTLTIRLDNLIARQVRAAGITDDYNRSIQLATGYTQELLGWIQELAVATPFSEETISSTVSLGLAMGWSVEGTKDLTSAILDYAAAQGLSNDVMERIIYNFAQMRMAGKVTGTELRDLARGAFMPIDDILEEAARQLGIAADQMDEFRQAAADGSIGIETFFNAFIAVVDRDMPDAARRMNFTFAAVMDNIRDLFRTLIGWNMIKPVLDSISVKLQRIVTSIYTPEVVRATKLLGMGFKYVYETLSVSLGSIVDRIRQLFDALGVGLPTLDSIIKSMIKFALAIARVAFAIGDFLIKTFGPAFREIGQRIEKETDAISDTMEGFGNDAFSWGFNLIVQFGKGIMRGVSTFLTKVMRFLANMLAGWLMPHSPPLIAPDIDLWGLETIAEWLHGFTMADFGVLDSLKDSLKGALGALVDLGVIDEEVSADMYVSISADLIAAMEEFNRTGEMSQVIYDQLGSVAGVFGDELITLLNAQVEFAVATERVADAQEAYNAAVEATQQSTRTVNTMIKEYNALLRGGADQATLEARLAELNAAEMQLALDREAEQAAENELQAAEDYLDVVEEMVQLQEELIQQLIDLAQAQADAAQAAAGGGGGAGGGEGGEAEDIDWGFGNLGLGVGEDLGAYFEALRLEAEEEFRRMWFNLRQQFMTQFNESFGPSSEFRRAWDRLVTILREKWDTFATALGLPTWDEIAGAFALGGEGETGFKAVVNGMKEVWDLFVDAIFGKGGKLGAPSPIQETFGEIEDLIENIGKIWDLLVSDIIKSGGSEDGEDGTITGTLSSMNKLLGGINDILEFVVGHWDSVKKTLSAIGIILAGFKFGGVGTGLYLTATVGLGLAVTNIQDWVYENIQRPIFAALGMETEDSASAMFLTLGQKIVDGLYTGIYTKFLEKAAEIGAWVTTNIIAPIATALGIDAEGLGESVKMEAVGRGTIAGLFSGIFAKLEEMRDSIGVWFDEKILSPVLEFFGIEKGKIEGGESSLFKNIGGGLIVGLFSGIFTKLGELRENIGTWLGDHILNPVLEFLGISKGKESGSSSLFRDIGVSIVQGIIDGIESMIGELVAAALAAISAIPDAVKDFIGCDSPAKLFIPIGESIPEGLAVGITRGAGIAQDAMMNATNRLMMSAPQSRLNMATMQAPQVNRGSTVSFGDVSINNGMDWAVFKAQVQRVILEA